MPGTELLWTNDDSVAHDVVADDGSFRSVTLQPGESFTFPADQAGSFPYHCSIHPFMHGTLVVN